MSAREVFGAYESVKILVLLNPCSIVILVLHVDTFRFCHFHSFEIYYFIDSSKMISKFPAVLDFNRLFLQLTAGTSWT